MCDLTPLLVFKQMTIFDNISFSTKEDIGRTNRKYNL